MNPKITCFLQGNNFNEISETITNFRKSTLIGNIFVISQENFDINVQGCSIIKGNKLVETDTIRKIVDVCDTDFAILYTKTDKLDLGLFSVERFCFVAEQTNAGLVYSDFSEIKDKKTFPHPVIDCQKGSLRDDFDFGGLLFFNSKALKEAVSRMDVHYYAAALYDLRLKVSQKSELIRIPEILYSTIEQDTRKSGEKIFDYVDPKNRLVQIEMEKACTQHLKDIKAFIHPNFKDIDLNAEKFDYEVSVIIPVRNRERTIADAIKSVFKQKANYKFNLIIIDNYSTDKTTEIIKEQAKKHHELIHIIPEREDLGIGGCWNLGVTNAKCGKFAVQLDSDDIYKDENTLQIIVDSFYKEKAAMVIGSYKLTDINLNDIPPGLIDHKEWTPENGQNNALRINGLGAPRCFYTPMLRSILIPNVSYGEDYAVALRISREYKIARIYDAIYMCRRWEDNSDASLDIVKQNTHNLYKDRIRTIELLARIEYNKKIKAFK